MPSQDPIPDFKTFVESQRAAQTAASGEKKPPASKTPATTAAPPSFKDFVEAQRTTKPIAQSPKRPQTKAEWDEYFRTGFAGKGKSVRAVSTLEKVTSVLPAAGGIVGGILAGSAAATSGYGTPATAAAGSAGATAGGAAGEAWRQLILRGGHAFAEQYGDLIQTGLAAITITNPEFGPVTVRASHEIGAIKAIPVRNDPGASATDIVLSGLWQGALDLIGRPLGGFIKGGAMAPRSLEDKAVAEASKKFGLELPAQEIGQGRIAGKVVRTLSGISNRAVGGKMIADAARERGEAAAVKAIEGDLDRMAGLARPSPLSSGTYTQAGLRVAKGGVKLAGKEVSRVAKAEPPLDIRPWQQQVKGYIERELKPLAEQVSGAARLRQVAAKLQNEPLDIESQIPKEIGAGSRALLQPGHPIFEAATKAAQEARDKQVAQLMKKADNLVEQKLKSSALYRKAQDILQMQPEVGFDTLKTFRTQLRRLGKDPDQLLGEADKPVFTHFKNGLSGLMEKASSEFQQASETYGTAARVFRSKVIDHAMKDDPELVVKSLTRPTRVRMVREALLSWSGYVPPGVTDQATVKAAKDRALQGRMTWESIRSTWFSENILKGDIAKLGERIRNVPPDMLRELYGADPAGQRLLQNATAIGTAIARHPNTTVQARVMLSMEVGRLAMAGFMGYSGGMTAAGETLGALELMPMMLNWAMYNPAVRDWLIEGFSAANSKQAAAAFTKATDSFIRTQLVPALGGQRSETPGYPFGPAGRAAAAPAPNPPTK